MTERAKANDEERVHAEQQRVADLFAEERCRKAECEREDYDTDTRRPDCERRNERNRHERQRIEIATNAATELNERLHTDEQQDAQLERGPRVGALPICVVGAVPEERDPGHDPRQVQPAELPAGWNKEAGQQECREQERGGQSPCRPRGAPDAERCLDEGRHMTAVLRPLPFVQQEKRSNVGKPPTPLGYRGGN